MTKKYFCTFADSRMWRSLKRLEQQVRASNYFDEICINNEMDLDTDFCEQFKEKLIKGTRGFGYWVWKPQIILQTLNKMNNGDLLLYMDVGCHFNTRGITRLNDYFEMTAKSPNGIVCFQFAKEAENKNLIIDNYIESAWTKGDLFDFFEVRDKKEFYSTGQMAATALLVRKCKDAEDILLRWLDVFKHDFSLVDNSPSISDNFPDFMEHRHDQSIISIISKKENIPSISAAEIWQKDWKKLETYPILKKGDKDLGFLLLMKRKINTAYRIINTIIRKSYSYIQR